MRNAAWCVRTNIHVIRSNGLESGRLDSKDYDFKRKIDTAINSCRGDSAVRSYREQNMDTYFRKIVGFNKPGDLGSITCAGFRLQKVPTVCLPMTVYSCSLGFWFSNPLSYLCPYLGQAVWKKIVLSVCGMCYTINGSNKIYSLSTEYVASRWLVSTHLTLTVLPDTVCELVRKCDKIAGDEMIIN